MFVVLSNLPDKSDQTRKRHSFMKWSSVLERGCTKGFPLDRKLTVILLTSAPLIISTCYENVIIHIEKNIKVRHNEPHVSTMIKR